MKVYIAVLHKDNESDYGVSFPDFPGCVTVGQDLNEAVEMAKEALCIHAESMIEDGEKLPHPSSLEDIVSRGLIDTCGFISVGLNIEENEVLLTPDQILNLERRPVNRECGIYFLIDNNEIVYVGQSIDVPTRVNSHRWAGKTKVFDSYSWIECPREQLDQLETKYIYHLRPRHNGTKHGPYKFTFPCKKTWQSLDNRTAKTI